MKKFKNKNIILGLIAILMVMSVGFVVNSYYVDSPKSSKPTYYSEALDRNFTEDGKVIYDENEKKLSVQDDTIATNLAKNKDNMITPSQQGWDGLKPATNIETTNKTKKDRVLITKGLEINKTAKVDSKGTEKAVADIKFYQEFEEDGVIKTIALGDTGTDGKLAIPQNKLVPGESYIVERVNTTETEPIKGKVDGVEKQFNEKRTPVYVDPEIRFLGEVEEDKLISYKDLREQIAKQNSLTNDTNLWGENTSETGAWLKFYNNKDKRLYYVAKTPIATSISKDNMKQLGLFDGVTVRLPEDPNNTQKMRSVIVRALSGEQNIKTVQNAEEITKRGSEWCNYIESIITPKSGSNTDYKLGNYDFSVDLNSNWLKEDKTGTKTFGEFRPIIQVGNCYDEACFDGEVEGTDFITYDKLITKIKENKNDPQTPFNIGTPTQLSGKEKDSGGNWLKIYDARENKTLYISKKPITYNLSWNSIYNAGAVYGLDMLNKDGTPKKSNLGFEQGIGVYEGNNTPPSEYKGKILTINGKNYIVRLLKGFNTSVNNGNPNIPSNGYQGEGITNHSEWNRYILPLVKAESGQRWGSSTKSKTFLEEELQDNTIQLAEYKWFGDLTSGNGERNWTQEFAENNRQYRAYRGYNNANNGAALSYSSNSNYTDYNRGFRPVLEEIN